VFADGSHVLQPETITKMDSRRHGKASQKACQTAFDVVVLPGAAGQKNGLLLAVSR